MPTKLWEPPRELVEGSLMRRYMDWLDRGFETYDDLWRWSVEDLDGFWASIWEHFERRLGATSASSARARCPAREWFPGAEINYAEHAFRGKPDDAVAIVHASELREQGEITWRELREQTARIAAGLRALGVGPGDRVAAYMPNIPEASPRSSRPRASAPSGRAARRTSARAA